MRRAALAALAALILTTPVRADVLVPICPSGWTARLLASLPFVRVSCPVDISGARRTTDERSIDVVDPPTRILHRTGDSVAPPDNPNRRWESRIDGGHPLFRDAYQRRYQTGLEPSVRS